MSKTKFYLANKVRLYPNLAQAELFAKNVGCARFIYNYYTAAKFEQYKEKVAWVKKGKDPKKFVWEPLPTESKLKETYDWLKEVDAQSLQAARTDSETAFKNYHKHAFGKPQFHKKGGKESFRTYSNGVDREGNKVRVGKHGWVSCRGLRSDVDGIIKSITVSRSAGKWYASILYEVAAHVFYQPKEFKCEAIGIDLGVVKPITYSRSDGKEGFVGIEVKAKLELLEKRRKKYQRRVARKVKGSCNRHKAKLQLQKAFEKERTVRSNFIEQASHRLTSNCETIAFEDLNLKGMTAKGKRKHGLNREMLRMRLGSFVSRCQAKATRYVSTVRLVNPRNTSRACSDCGTVDKESRKSQSRYECVHCGFTLNADINAARNILSLGLA